MELIYRFLYNPFTFQRENDRRRRAEPQYYGKYQPSRLKRYMIWIMNEKIDPIDWEEVPPFFEPEEEGASLQVPRDATIHPYECLTQPNMLTQENIYVRRLILLGLFFLIYRHLEKKRFKYRNFYGLGEFYYLSIITRIVSLSWFYYLACKSFAHKDYQLPYN